MTYRNLINWQATFLGEALWSHQNGMKAFEAIEPVIPLERPRFGAVGLSNRRPAVLIVEVSALPEGNLPAHTVQLMSTDYDAARKSLNHEEMAAWNSYLGKARRSSIYGAKTRVRKRVEGGRVVATRNFFYIEPNDGITRSLEAAVKKILSYADRPNREKLELLWDEQQLAKQKAA